MVGLLSTGPTPSSFCDGGGRLVFGGGALLIGGSHVCDDLGGVSTGDDLTP